MKIRSLKKNDAEKVKKLLAKCGKPYVPPYNLYVYWMLERYLSKTCKVAEKDNKVVGFVSGMPDIERQVVFIWQLCVDKELRKQGIATGLLDALFQEARDMDYNYIELSITDSNNISQSFFQKYAEKKGLKLKEIDEKEFGENKEIIFQIPVAISRKYI